MEKMSRIVAMRSYFANSNDPDGKVPAPEFTAFWKSLTDTQKDEYSSQLAKLLGVELTK